MRLQWQLPLFMHSLLEMEDGRMVQYLEVYRQMWDRYFELVVEIDYEAI